jgi:hypothetical protein
VAEPKYVTLTALAVRPTFSAINATIPTTHIRSRLMSFTSFEKRNQTNEKQPTTAQIFTGASAGTSLAGL